MAEKLKKVVIREEYVAITGNYQLALVLNQLIYWSERIDDFDKFIAEENARLDTEGLPEISLTHGWIYKSAKQLSCELMTGWSERTVGRYIKKLENLGFIHSRRNPKHKWDRTLQYRVDFNTVQESLKIQGYALQGYREHPQNGFGKMSDGGGKMSDRSVQDVKTIPETTTEITTTTTTDNPIPSSSPPFFPENLSDLLPPGFAKPSVVAMIRKHADKGEEYILQAIAYSNDNSKKASWQSYKSFLGRALEEGWGIGYEPGTGAAPAVSFANRYILYQGTHRKSDDKGAIWVGEQKISAEQLAKLVAEGKAEIAEV